MNRIIILLIAFLLIWGQSCKNDKAGKDLPEIETSGNLDTAGYTKLEGNRSVSSERALATNMLDGYYKENKPTQEFFTTRYFVVDAAHQVKDSSTTLMSGEWFVLSEDWTYKWYKKKELLHSGKYYFTQEKPTLLFLSDNEEFFPSEWTVAGHDDVVILIGTSTFRNNDTQIKLDAKTTLPYKI
jgi:hypothetical protein